MQTSFTIQTREREGLFDITAEVQAIVQKSNVQTGMVQVYAQGATAAIMI